MGGGLHYVLLVLLLGLSCALAAPQPPALAALSNSSSCPLLPFAEVVSQADIVNKTVLVVYLNNNMRNLVGTLICSLRRAAILDGVLFWALDTAIGCHLHKIGGLNVFAHHKYRSVMGGLHHSSAAFLKLTFSKFGMMELILKEGYNVMFMDADVVFWEDPRPFLAAYTADLVWQKEVPGGSKRGPPEPNQTIWAHPCHFNPPNTGVWYARSNSRTVGFMRAARALIQRRRREDRKKHDQDIVTTIILDANLTSSCLRPFNRPCLTCAGDAVTYEYLDPVLFPTYFAIRYYTPSWKKLLAKQHREDPVLLHLNSKWGGPKSSVMKNYGLWLLDKRGKCIKPKLGLARRLKYEEPGSPRPPDKMNFGGSGMSDPATIPSKQVRDANHSQAVQEF